jgi:hypothetical protein
MKNVKPCVERNSSNTLTKLESVRDQIHGYFLAACAQQHVEALVLKSHPFSSAVWVKFECWVPHRSAQQLSDRSSALVTIHPREFHRFEYEIDLTVQDGQHQKEYKSIYEFRPDDAARIVRHLVREFPYARLRLPLRRLRRYRFQLWRPKNKVVRLHTRWLPTVLTWMTMGGILSLFSGVPEVIFVGLVVLAFAALFALISYRRQCYVISSGKPPQEPRNLIRVDSWQTLVYELGKEADNVRAALKTELLKAQQEGFLIQDENIWYWGVDGTEERKQIVVMFRRATGFLHVYPYAHDLYVGWDAHVNCGTWLEKDIGTGIDPTSRELARLKAVEPGWNTPSEYDITDTNCLIEWIHGAVTKVVKRMLAEHKIDQEIDFKIIRGERQGIAGRQQEGEKKSRFASFRLTRQS